MFMPCMIMVDKTVLYIELVVNDHGGIYTSIVAHTQYIYIYSYIKWTVFVSVTTKSAQHAYARMIAIIVEKRPNSSHMYDHGFMDNTNPQAVCKSQ